MRERSAALFLAAVVAFASIAADPVPARISQADFKALLPSRPAVVDVRDTASFREGHIPGAILLAFEGRTTLPPGSDALIARLKASKRPVITYCACHGETASVRAAAELLAAGVPDVRALTGGWADWVNAGNKVEK